MCVASDMIAPGVQAAFTPLGGIEMFENLITSSHQKMGSVEWHGCPRLLVLLVGQQLLT